MQEHADHSSAEIERYKRNITLTVIIEKLSDQLGKTLNVSTHARPMMVTVLVNGVELQMEVDTGASVSLIS